MVLSALQSTISGGGEGYSRAEPIGLLYRQSLHEKWIFIKVMLLLWKKSDTILDENYFSMSNQDQIVKESGFKSG